MKKFLRQFVLFSLLAANSSCAYLFNEKNVDVSINSSPAGADIFIEGRNYGKTPALLNLEPKSYSVVLSKEGYGSTQLKLESWQAIREKDGEGGRCLADAFGTMLVLPALSYWSVYCREFKQKEYFVNIPRNSANSGTRGNSMMGLGQNPSDMINYYYNQDMMRYGGNSSQNRTR